MTNLTDEVLGPLLARDRMGPRITYYDDRYGDDATGERIELSTATLENWAAKTANLLRDELGAGPGTRVAVLLPAHWQTAAVLLGIWWVGAEVVATGPADIALCTRGRLEEADAAVDGGEVAVLSLDPFGKPAEDLPIGVTDYATAVRVHGDQIVPERSAGLALEGASVDEALAAARERAEVLGVGSGDRVMSLEPLSIDDLLAVLASGASLIMVANPDPAALERRRATEKVTRTLG
jgi:uncharacterized protein (TIGR03089 family)